MTYHETYYEIINECHSVLSLITEDDTNQLIDAILSADKVFFVGVGRVLLSLQAICKRFNHIGIQAFFVGEINEPAISPDDLLIVASGSGESIIPVEIAKKAYELHAKIALISSNPCSTISALSNIFVRIPAQSKLGLVEEVKSYQPMTSLFEQSVLLYGDTLSKMIIDRKHLDMNALWKHHANLE